jgi:phosphatidylglycerol:prolipoprotein diacylglycerol transferase
MVNIPIFDPIAFTIFNWPVRWYGLSYMAAFFTCWYFIKKFSNHYYKKYSEEKFNIQPKTFDDLLTYCIIGIIVGARLGHMVFYDFDKMVSNPVSIFKTWEGGMAFHGGLMGCVVGALIVIHKKKLPLAYLADLVSLVVPTGLFFGRMGNFINGELRGRITDGPFGVFIGDETVLRYPSQLIEGFTEGILLFLILSYVFLKKSSPKNQGLVCSYFFLGYGFFRFFCEYIREPSDGIFHILSIELTYGQILTLPMFLIGFVILVIVKKKKILLDRNEGRASILNL